MSLVKASNLPEDEKIPCLKSFDLMQKDKECNTTLRLGYLYGGFLVYHKRAQISARGQRIQWSQLFLALRLYALVLVYVLAQTHTTLSFLSPGQVQTLIPVEDVPIDPDLLDPAVVFVTQSFGKFVYVVQLRGMAFSEAFFAFGIGTLSLIFKQC